MREMGGYISLRRVGYGQRVARDPHGDRSGRTHRPACSDRTGTARPSGRGPRPRAPRSGRGRPARHPMARTPPRRCAGSSGQAPRSAAKPVCISAIRDCAMARSTASSGSRPLVGKGLGQVPCDGDGVPQQSAFGRLQRRNRAHQRREARHVPGEFRTVEDRLDHGDGDGEDREGQPAAQGPAGIGSVADEEGRSPWEKWCPQARISQSRFS